MSELLIIHRDSLTFSEFAARLERHRVDTVVDARPSDEPGDFSFSVLAALCSAFGYGYLRRGDRLGTRPAGGLDRTAIAAAMGSVVELSKAGRVALLVGSDPAHLVQATPDGEVAWLIAAADGSTHPWEDHLPIDPA